MTHKPSRAFHQTSQVLLNDSTIAAGYLEDILEDGGMKMFTAALKDVANARLGGIGPLAKKTVLSREQLYKTLSKKGNPRLATLTQVLGAMGLRLAVSPNAPTTI